MRQGIKIALFVIGALGLVSSGHAQNDNAYSDSVSAFIKYDVNDKTEFSDPLTARRTIRVPNDIRTIVDGLHIILAGTSYDLNQSVLKSEETKHIMGKAYPDSQRLLTDVTTLEALSYVIGKHHTVLVDPVYRQIGFELQRAEEQTQ